mmetsp:Transcript_17468/g.26182  ORF Transcript_17468/g.26182 Transcript_17468/m.26182 type:complete len:334 (+) Transcript_17468:34-1035(+)
MEPLRTRPLRGKVNAFGTRKMNKFGFRALMIEMDHPENELVEKVVASLFQIQNQLLPAVACFRAPRKVEILACPWPQTSKMNTGDSVVIIPKKFIRKCYEDQPEEKMRLQVQKDIEQTLELRDLIFNEWLPPTESTTPKAPSSKCPSILGIRKLGKIDLKRCFSQFDGLLTEEERKSLALFKDKMSDKQLRKFSGDDCQASWVVRKENSKSRSPKSCRNRKRSRGAIKDKERRRQKKKRVVFLSSPAGMASIAGKENSELKGRADIPSEKDIERCKLQNAWLKFLGNLGKSASNKRLLKKEKSEALHMLVRQGVKSQEKVSICYESQFTLKAF